LVGLFIKVMKRTVSPSSTFITKIVKGGKNLAVMISRLCIQCCLSDFNKLTSFYLFYSTLYLVFNYFFILLNPLHLYMGAPCGASFGQHV
jgi:hypothetical protein